jgi:DNA-binding Lrp family transcriptional regulator
VTEDTQQAIAEDLGVSPQTVGRSIDELQDSGKQFQVESINTDEKREQVRGGARLRSLFTSSGLML